MNPLKMIHPSLHGEQDCLVGRWWGVNGCDACINLTVMGSWGNPVQGGTNDCQEMKNEYKKLQA